MHEIDSFARESSDFCIIDSKILYSKFTNRFKSLRLVNLIKSIRKELSHDVMDRPLMFPSISQIQLRKSICLASVQVLSSTFLLKHHALFGRHREISSGQIGVDPRAYYSFGKHAHARSEDFEVNINNNNNNNLLGLCTCSFRDDYIDVVRGRKSGGILRRSGGPRARF